MYVCIYVCMCVCIVDEQHFKMKCFTYCVEAVKGPSIAQYESLYITSHKAPALAGAFSWDGQLAASGSADTTIRVRTN